MAPQPKTRKQGQGLVRNPSPARDRTAQTSGQAGGARRAARDSAQHGTSPGPRGQSRGQGRTSPEGPYLQFDDFRCAGPGALSASVGYSSNHLRLDGRPSGGVFKPFVRRAGSDVAPEQERRMVEELDHSFPGSREELNRLASAGSKDTASGLSMSSINGNTSMVEGLVVSISLNSAQNRDDSFCSTNSAFQRHTHGTDGGLFGSEEDGRKTAVHVTGEDWDSLKSMRAVQISPAKPKRMSDRK